MGTKKARLGRWVISTLGSLALLLLLAWSSVLVSWSSASAPVLQGTPSPGAYLPFLARPLPTATLPPGSGPVDGLWSGMTNQPAPLSFTISNNGTIWKNVLLSARSGGCGTFVFLDGPGTISNGKFASSSQGSSITGQFTSRTSAQGTFTVAFNGACGLIGTVSGTWTAAPETAATATPTKTSNATATPTRTSTPTSTPTQTSGPGTIVILGSTFTYVDSTGYLHLVGEVQNNTNTKVRLVKITAKFLNANNQLVATQFAFTFLDILPPSTKTCFDVSLQEPAGWTHYQFEAPTFFTTTQATPRLTLLNDSGAVDPTFHWYTITGQIRNDDTVQWNYVEAVGTVYNAAGKATGCGLTFVTSTHESPGQTSSFTLYFTGRNYSDVASYRLQTTASSP